MYLVPCGSHVNASTCFNHQGEAEASGASLVVVCFDSFHGQGLRR